MASPSLQHQLFFHRPAFFVYSRQTLSLLPASTLYLRACCTRDRCPFLPLPALSAMLPPCSRAFPRIPAASARASYPRLPPPSRFLQPCCPVLLPAHFRAFPRLQPVPVIPACPRLSGFCSPAAQPCCPALLPAHSLAFPRPPLAPAFPCPPSCVFCPPLLFTPPQKTVLLQPAPSLYETGFSASKRKKQAPIPKPLANPKGIVTFAIAKISKQQYNGKFTNPEKGD